MEGGVVAVLHPWEPVELVSGAVTGETPEVHGDGFVHRLGLAICLWMECRAHTELHTGLSKQITPHVTEPSKL
jgi:hypothetical protein